MNLVTESPASIIPPSVRRAPTINKNSFPISYDLPSEEEYRRNQKVTDKPELSDLEFNFTKEFKCQIAI